MNTKKALINYLAALNLAAFYRKEASRWPRGYTEFYTAIKNHKEMMTCARVLRLNAL
jgi:hypothetical protein